MASHSGSILPPLSADATPALVDRTILGPLRLRERRPAHLRVRDGPRLGAASSQRRLQLVRLLGVRLLHIRVERAASSQRRLQLVRLLGGVRLRHRVDSAASSHRCLQLVRRRLRVLHGLARALALRGLAVRRHQAVRVRLHVLGCPSRAVRLIRGSAACRDVGAVSRGLPAACSSARAAEPLHQVRDAAGHVLARLHVASAAHLCALDHEVALRRSRRRARGAGGSSGRPTLGIQCRPRQLDHVRAVVLHRRKPALQLDPLPAVLLRQSRLYGLRLLLTQRQHRPSAPRERHPSGRRSWGACPILTPQLTPHCKRQWGAPWGPQATQI